jgi:hypothetical protein
LKFNICVACFAFAITLANIAAAQTTKPSAIVCDSFARDYSQRASARAKCWAGLPEERCSGLASARLPAVADLAQALVQDLARLLEVHGGKALPSRCTAQPIRIAWPAGFID